MPMQVRWWNEQALFYVCFNSAFAFQPSKLYSRLIMVSGFLLLCKDNGPVFLGHEIP